MNQNIFGDCAISTFTLAGFTTVVPVDERDYHNALGSIHCGTNVIRSVPSLKWWEK